jgi:hypothetical protein
MVTNYSNSEYPLKKDTPIAVVSTMDLTDPETCRLLAINQHEDVAISESDAERPPHDERLTILREIGLVFSNDNLTLEEFRQLTALLYDYREMFCSDIDELPISTLPPYYCSYTV